VRRPALLLALLAAIASAALAAAPAGSAVPGGGQIVARGIPYATNVTFDPAGGMWVTAGAGEPTSADGVWYVPHLGARPRHVIKATNTALGLTWFRNRLYVASIVSQSTGIVAAYSGFDGHRFRHRVKVVPYLPVGHNTLDSIVPGPNGRLYLGAGSEYDHQRAGHKTSGTILSFKPDGSDLRIEATGVRNPYGLAFIPGTASLLFTDNARDDLGPSRPPDELNLIRDVTKAAPDFGFPDCYDQGGAHCRGTAAPLALFPPHASSDGLAVTRHWRGGNLTAFVAENGATILGAHAGNDIRRVALTRLPGGGYHASVSVFASGFAEHDPLGAAIGPDGALYVTLFLSAEVIRYAP
jgi:glucose/arabinose dehydrogenase